MIRRNIGIWLAASALGALSPLGGALAADLPVKAKPIVAATFDWSGVYIGAHAGYGGGMKDWSPGVVPQNDFIARGWLAGGQIGINKQLGSFVLGVEAAGSWADIGGSPTLLVGSPTFTSNATYNYASKIDGIATIAGRAGLAADRWFVFAKAGLSAVHEKHSANSLLTAGPAFVALTGSGTEVRYAPMLGFGTEYALTGNWSLFGEYNYHHLGARTSKFDATATNGVLTFTNTVDLRIDQSIHVVKAGVNYRWGGVAIDPSYAAVRPAPGNNWSGGYIGVQGGYAWGGKDWPENFGSPANFSYRTDGWLAGGTIGANAQSGILVFGVEGEILGTGIKGSQSQTSPIAGAGTQTVTASSSIDWLALATARAGFVVGSNVLLYGKGGVAIAEESHRIVATQVNPTAVADISAKLVHTGVVVGAGGEYAIAPNWSVKAEYDYVKMFPQSAMLTGNASGGPFGTGIAFAFAINKLQQDLHLVKFGVNYHFNPLPVVVAKY